MSAKKPNQKMQAWIEARELGMNPKKLGKIDNRKQQRWKAPLPEFIEYLYFKQFKKERPDAVKELGPWRGPQGLPRRHSCRRLEFGLFSLPFEGTPLLNPQRGWRLD